MESFGLQLYSLRDVPRLKKRLEIAAEAGYTGVEFAGYEDMTAQELKAELKKLGLRGMGSHVQLDRLQNHLDEEVKFCAEAGIETVCCPWYTMETREQALKAAALFEDCAAAFGREGIRFGYHNHHHEFAAPDGVRLLELMIQNTSKTFFELDVFWAAYAGVDPVAFIRSYAGRFDVLHLKEMNDRQENVELGTGSLDMEAIVRAGLAQGTDQLTVEQEQYTMAPADSVRMDADYMKHLKS